MIIFLKNVLIGRVLFLIYCALSEYKHFEQLTHVVHCILIILKENRVMQILSAEKIKILNIAFSLGYISLHSTCHFFLGVSNIRIISYLCCVSRYNFFCITRYMHHDWNSYSTPASQVSYAGTMECPIMPGPVEFIG